MTETTAALDDQNFMKALLDLVIPPSLSGERPGAGALGLEPAVATAIQADPMLGPLSRRGRWQYGKRLSPSTQRASRAWPRKPRRWFSKPSLPSTLSS